MKRIALIALIISYLMMGNAWSQDFSKLLDGYFAYNRFWGSVLITRDDKVLFSKSYGFADKDKGIRNDSNTLFNLESLTKTMTATAIMKLDEDGKLSIYDRVDKYIPGFISDDPKDIRITNLLNHTSGMVANLCQRDDQGNGMVRLGNEPVTMDELISKFKETKLKHLPGTEFEYNNYAYVLLAYIIEKVSGMDYKDYLQKAIFSPAAMCNTFYRTDLKGSSSIGYEGIGSGSTRIFYDNSDPSWIIGASNIYSSVTDLAKYLKAEFSYRILSDKTLKIMLDTCVKSSFLGKQWTLGWIKQSSDNLTTYSHSGNGDGFERNATEELKDTFNKEGAAALSGAWKYLTSTNGKYQSYSLYKIINKAGYNTYYMAYHFEKADLLMELSFNNDGLINGFFITSILPKCEAKRIKMIAVSKEEYFIDGYRYGGFKDYRIRFDKSRQTLNFSAEGDDFNATKI